MFSLKTIRTKVDESPKDYVLNDPGLKKAVDLAIWLQKPLLLTGAPGTGKTRLAGKIAYELSRLSGEGLMDQMNTEFSPFLAEPLVFHTKTVSNASDLFYHYDAIGHFRESPIIEEGQKEKDEQREARIDTAHKYIELNAYGKAIAQTWGREKIIGDKKLSPLQHLHRFDELAGEPRSSVVLIDEIDKAPRDFPNDLLNEIENIEFTLRELNLTLGRNPTSPARIVLLLTSNFEKNLPDAFLRRCLFYHIHPPQKESLLDIVCTRMKAYLDELDRTGAEAARHLSKDELMERYSAMVRLFEEMAADTTDKVPTTAELLEWLKVLELEQFFDQKMEPATLTEQQRTILRYTLPILFKSKDDMKKMLERYSSAAPAKPV